MERRTHKCIHRLSPKAGGRDVGDGGGGGGGGREKELKQGNVQVHGQKPNFKLAIKDR